MIMHIVCRFDNDRPEEAPALGTKPERFVRPLATTEFHSTSETGEIQFEGREHAAGGSV